MTRYPTLTEAAAALRAGEVTCVRLVEDAIEIGDATDRVGSFLNRFNEQALAAARAADDALTAGAAAGPLHGIPLGVKDIIATREAPATAQGLVLDPGWHPGNAMAVARLRAAGGIVLAKTTTMEFAIGIPDASKPFPVPRNPWNLDYWAGGSSSGSGHRGPVHTQYWNMTNTEATCPHVHAEGISACVAVSEGGATADADSSNG